MSFIY